MTMQVLQICHSYYPPFLDCARQYAALFNGTPYKVVTVYLSGEPNEEVIRGSASDEVIFLGYTSKQIGGLKLGAIAKIRRIVRQQKFQFCIAHRVKPTYVALLATNLPVVSVHHNYNDYKRASRRLLVNFFRERLFMLCVSNSVRDEMRQHLSGWPIERIQTLYNRIDVEAVQQGLLTRQQARDVLHLSQDSWVVGNVGRLHRDKDQKTLIKAFAKALPELPANSVLVILGKGPLEDELMQLIKELKVEQQVKLLGFVPEAQRLFRAFDVFALTSDHEPFGMVLLEAMAAQVPIVASNCGGGAEVAGEGGRLFTLGNDAELAGIFIEMARNKTESTGNALLHHFSDQSAFQHFWSLPWSPIQEAAMALRSKELTNE